MGDISGFQYKLRPYKQWASQFVQYIPTCTTKSFTVPPGMLLAYAHQTIQLGDLVTCQPLIELPDLHPESLRVNQDGMRLVKLVSVMDGYFIVDEHVSQSDFDFIYFYNTRPCCYETLKTTLKDL